MKTILTYGTFDLFHYGHLKILERAKALGDKLIVGVSTDEFNLLKEKKFYHSFDERKHNVESIKFVDLVIPENNWEQKKYDIINYKVDILVMGDDWKGKFDIYKQICEIVYLERTPFISSSLIKGILNEPSTSNSVIRD